MRRDSTARVGQHRVGPKLTAFSRQLSVISLLAAVAACAPYPQRIKDAPIVDNGRRLPAAEGTAMGAETEIERARAKALMDSLFAAASASCEPASCAAVARGELLLGMSETQVYAASRSTPAAWSVRRSGTTAVMVPASASAAPRDANGAVAMVQFDGPRVSEFAYREPQGLRVVTRAEDATAQARARAVAAALIREGDELVATNDLAGALNRFDRASVLVPDDPDVQFKTARILDLQLRPLEALMRYQRFLQSLDLERIRAHGEANAKLAEAIAMARQRILILEKQVR